MYPDLDFPAQVSANVSDCYEARAASWSGDGGRGGQLVLW